MSKSTEEAAGKMQDEFEAAVAVESGESVTAIFLSRKADTYSTSTLHFAWWAWKASRSAIVVTLPESELMGVVDAEWGLRESAVISAINAVGVKVRSQE